LSSESFSVFIILGGWFPSLQKLRRDYVALLYVKFLSLTKYF